MTRCSPNPAEFARLSKFVVCIVLYAIIVAPLGVASSVSPRAPVFAIEPSASVASASASSPSSTCEAGRRDTAFGTNGVALTRFTNLQATPESAYASVLQPDGKIVLLGQLGNSTLNQYGLTRYNTNGSLDTSFDGDGWVATDLPGLQERLLAAAIQADGKIVAAGNVYNGSIWVFAVVRYNTDGSPDNSFGSGGIVNVAFNGQNDAARGVAIQADGKIVVAGDTGSAGGTHQDFAVARLNTDGTLDNTFDGDGKLTTTFSGSTSNFPRSVLVQPDGKIVVSGKANNDFAAARYNTDGSLDTSFDGDGMVTTDVFVGSFEEAWSSVIQPDGKLLLGGVSGANNGLTLVRYNTDGSLDQTFDSDGKASTTVGVSGGIANSIAVQSDGKIVAGSQARVVPGLPATYDFAAVRFNSDGSLDSTFGTGGKVTTDLGSADEDGRSILIQADGRIVLAGSSNSNFAAVRYNTDGTLDTSFDGDGIVLTNFDNVPIAFARDLAYGVGIQADGKIVSAGESYRSLAVARHNPDGTIDTTFSGDGMVMTGVAGKQLRGLDLVIQPDGKTVVAGQIWDLNGGGSNPNNYEFLLARYNADGSLDNSFDGDGMVITDLGGFTGEFAAAVVLQPDGKIIAAGGSAGDFALARYNIDGSLDTSFAGDGTVKTSILSAGSDDTASAVTLQPDGKIVAAGGAGGNFAVARYNPDGSLDTSFSSDGKHTTIVGSFAAASSVAIQDDGKIVLGGSGRTGASQDEYDFAVVRYNPNGTLDTTFDTDGRLTTPIGTWSDTISSLAIQPEGKILAVGTYSISGSPSIAMARYTSNGALDPSFGNGGKVTTNLADGQEEAYAVALRPDSGFVVAGNHTPGTSFGGTRFALIQYSGECNIALEESGGDLTDGASAINFGPGTVGVAGSPRTFTVRNTGTEVLPLGAVTVDGANAGDFSVDTTGMASSLSPGASTTFTLTYTAGGLGARSAALHVASDDPDEGPFDIGLSGVGVSTDLYAVNVTAVNGTVTSSPAGINCPGDCSGEFTGGSNVTLTAQPVMGYRFVGWSGDAAGSANPLTVSINGGKNITAVFAQPPPQAVRFDYDGDGRADLSIRRPQNDFWYIQTLTSYTVIPIGNSSLSSGTADWDGDGKFDRAAFSQGAWRILLSQSNQSINLTFGQSGDLSLPADRTGDGLAEAVVFRPSTATWYTRYSQTVMGVEQFGEVGDKPVLGDFDGDGTSDIAVYRPSNNTWYIKRSSQGIVVMTWGAPGDIPVPADYDGDRLTDIAVWRPSTGRWYIVGSSIGWLTSNAWGLPSDKPVPADYDGDGKTDLAVWRPSTGTWYIVNSSNSTFYVRQFGLSNDVPVPGTYIY